uniref:Neurexin 2 n=1 Tax=Cavia porcellus TaxID=10141 RepID=H0W504_CAVPO
MGTALLQRGGCALLCLALLLLGCWAELGSGLEFPGAEGQWTRFPKWNACCESELSFELKTRAARGLVLYFDDEGFCDFLELVLTRGGRLQLSFSIFCAEPATLLADTPLNDGAWHRVRLRRQFRNTTLLIDRVEARWVEVQSKRRGLFVGRLPPSCGARAQAHARSVREHDGAEVRLDDDEPSGGGPCEAEEGEGGVCLNGGVCSVVDDRAVCDCSRTGFRGEDCSQDKHLEGGARM